MVKTTLFLLCLTLIICLQSCVSYTIIEPLGKTSFTLTIVVVGQESFTIDNHLAFSEFRTWNDGIRTVAVIHKMENDDSFVVEGLYLRRDEGLSSGTTYDLTTTNILQIRHNPAFERYGGGNNSIDNFNSGSMTIEVYDGNSLKGSFNCSAGINGYTFNFTGTFDCAQIYRGGP